MMDWTIKISFIEWTFTNGCMSRRNRQLLNEPFELAKIFRKLVLARLRKLSRELLSTLSHSLYD